MEPIAAILAGRTIVSPRERQTCRFRRLQAHERIQNSCGCQCDWQLGLSIGHTTNEKEKDQVGEIFRHIQEATGQNVKIAFVDQGYKGEKPAKESTTLEIDLFVVKLAEVRKGFVLLPRRWVVERTIGWMNRFRRLAKDYERLCNNLAGYHWIAVVTLALNAILTKSA